MPIFNNILAGASGQGDTGYDIDQSLRFEEDDASKLSRTFTSAGNRKTWTLSTWVKLSGLDTTDHGELFNGYDSGSDTGFTTVYWYNGKLRVAGWGTTWRETSQEFRDPSAWYHLVVAFDTTESAADDRCKIYVNGSQVTAFGTNNALSQDTDYGINGAWVHQIGQDNSASSSRNLSGYMAEFHFIDGQALTPASFGETDSATNQWVPVEYSGSYGTNGFYLKFQDSSALGDDSSGNTNDFAVTNLVATDQVLDSPTNNFATLNPLDYQGSITASEGNLTATTSSGDPTMKATFALPSTGKWYWEFLMQYSTSMMIGVVDQTSTGAAYSSNKAVLYSSGLGTKYNFSSVASYGASWTTGDLMGVAFNRDDNEITFYKNNSAQPTLTIGGTADQRSRLIPLIVTGTGGTGGGTFNFGQDSSFAGAKTAQGNTDGNGIGDFYYTPPSGYLALCSDNLSDPSIADPTAHFNSTLWTGDTSTYTDTRAITGAGHAPDLVWLKNRDYGSSHDLYDSVRGGNKNLHSNTTDSETTNIDGGWIDSFDSDGFTLKIGGGGTSEWYDNRNGNKIVGWSWKAGGTASSNTDGSITSSVSANTTAGFSVGTYTGNGTAGATVGHGLSGAGTPEMIIIKNRDDPTAHSWIVYHKDVGATKALELNSTSAEITSSLFFNNTAPTSSVFSIGTGGTNTNTYSRVFYAFTSIDGYSKVGSYTGSGSSDGPFVYTGFRPAFVMVKSSNAIASWWMGDTARETYNGGAGTYGWLQANASDAEADYTAIDHLSNGFKLRDVHGGLNGSGSTYLYLAFAESPFKTSNAR